MDSNEFEFTDECRICDVTDNTVWEIVQGIALCEAHQEEWFQSRLPITRWLEKKLRNV